MIIMTSCISYGLWEGSPVDLPFRRGLDPRECSTTSAPRSPMKFGQNSASKTRTAGALHRAQRVTLTHKKTSCAKVERDRGTTVTPTLTFNDHST